MVELEADFSTTVRHGMILAYLGTTSEDVHVGDIVTAVDRDEDLSYTGTIVEIDGQDVYLLMHWRDRNPAYIYVPTFGENLWFSVASHARPLPTSGGGGARDEEGGRGDQIAVPTLAAV